MGKSTINGHVHERLPEATQVASRCQIRACDSNDILARSNFSRFREICSVMTPGRGDGKSPRKMEVYGKLMAKIIYV
jgi:hypothetical protein